MTTKPLDLAALQAICEDIGETLRQEAVASGTMLLDWSDDRGVIEIDPVTGKILEVKATDATIDQFSYIEEGRFFRWKARQGYLDKEATETTVGVELPHARGKT